MSAQTSFNRAQSNKGTAALLLCATLLALSSPAYPQDADSVGSQIDSDRFRDEGMADSISTRRYSPFAIAAKEVEAKYFRFFLSLPTTYNSNPSKADGTKDDAAHLGPSAGLQWKRAFNKLSLTARGVINYDEFTGHEDADQSAVLGAFEAAYGDPAKVLTPYVGYAPSVAYTSLLDDHVVTLHDLIVGIRREIALPMCASSRVALDFAYSRREASVSASEQHRPTIAAVMKCRVADTVELVFKQNVQARLYSASSNDGRDDVNFKSGLGADWQVSPLTTLGFLIAYERNESDRASKDYSVWDIGPSVTAAFAF